jgi:cytochrome P450
LVRISSGANAVLYSRKNATSRAIMRDPELYGPDAHLFNPDRFMKGDKLDPSVPYPDAAFGYGRRTCPGKTAAETSMWISVASMLAAFEFSRKDDGEGEFGEFSSGIVS